MAMAPTPTGHDFQGGPLTVYAAIQGSAESCTMLSAKVPLSVAECRAAVPRRMTRRDPLRERLLAMILQNESSRKAGRR